MSASEEGQTDEKATGMGRQNSKGNSHSPSKRRRGRRDEVLRRKDQAPAQPDHTEGTDKSDNLDGSDHGADNGLPTSCTGHDADPLGAAVESGESDREDNSSAVVEPSQVRGPRTRDGDDTRQQRRSKMVKPRMVEISARADSGKNESDKNSSMDSPRARGSGGNPDVVEAIRNLLLMIPVDVEKLRNMAWEVGGYQTDEVRIKVWPKLLGLDRHGLEDFRRHLEAPHSMAEQIQRDIDRSLTHFLHVRKWKRQRTQSKRDKLRDVINAVVRKYDGVLNYYQGYHDVVATMLLVTGDCQLAFALTERISHYFFRDSMRDDFAVLTYLLHLVPVVVHVFDREVADFVSKSRVEPYYCMAWVLTWFAHDLRDLHAVARIYDALLGAHPLLILYVSAAVVLSTRSEILACDCDFASVHSALSHAAKGVGDWEPVLLKAKGMFMKCPPRELVKQAPAYIKDTLSAGGVTALEFPPPWFTGTSLPDWILLEQRREKEGKPRISKAAKQWRKAARLAGAENPDEMLVAYSNVSNDKFQTVGGARNLMGKFMSQMRMRRRKWKVLPSPITVLSAAVLLGAVSYTYTLHSSARYSQWGLPP